MKVRGINQRNLSVKKQSKEGIGFTGDPTLVQCTETAGRMQHAVFPSIFTVEIIKMPAQKTITKYFVHKICLFGNCSVDSAF